MPTFAAMISAAVAVWYSHRVAQVERRRDDDHAAAARSAQAEDISAWVGEEPLLWVRNVGRQPVYGIEVTLHLPEGGHCGRCTDHQQHVLGPQSDWTFKVCTQCAEAIVAALNSPFPARVAGVHRQPRPDLDPGHRRRSSRGLPQLIPGPESRRPDRIVTAGIPGAARGKESLWPARLLASSKGNTRR